MPLRTPRGKKRTALLGIHLKQVFRRDWYRPVAVVPLRDYFHPILLGSAEDFEVGDLEVVAFLYIRDWVENKIRHHLARAGQRHGFGWQRWSLRVALRHARTLRRGPVWWTDR